MIHFRSQLGNGRLLSGRLQKSWRRVNFSPGAPVACCTQRGQSCLVAKASFQAHSASPLRHPIVPFPLHGSQIMSLRFHDKQYHLFHFNKLGICHRTSETESSSPIWTHVILTVSRQRHPGRDAFWITLRACNSRPLSLLSCVGPKVLSRLGRLSQTTGLHIPNLHQALCALLVTSKELGSSRSRKLRIWCGAQPVARRFSL